MMRCGVYIGPLQQDRRPNGLGPLDWYVGRHGGPREMLERPDVDMVWMGNWQ
jgi:hypothetical protein